MKICKVQSGTRAETQAGQPGQALNPPYLVGLPAVDRVKREIQGDSPTDTLARQVAVLTGLSQVVKRMQMVPTRRYNSFTPDELKFINAYELAAYELSQAYLKSHTPEEGKAFEQLHGRYEMNPAVGDETFKLLSPALLAEYGKIDAAANAHYQAHVDQQRRENEEARAQAARAQGQGSSQFVRNDPGTVAVRRCLELGGGELECMGKGLTTGLFDMTGLGAMSPDAVEAAAVRPGLRMGGGYKGENGIGIGFNEKAAGVSGCGKLEPEGRDYSIAKRGNQLLITIKNEPKPLLVVLGPDGKLTGPGPADVTGKIIVGYRKFWVEERRVSDNTVVPGSGHEVQEPIYGPKTERCVFATLRPTAPVQAQGSLIGQVVGIFGGQPADQAARQSDTAQAPAGPRMAGQFSGQGGLRLEFHPTATVLDCGEAHVLKPYAVENTADRIIVTVRNGDAPLTLTLQPDGTLTGSGAVDVAGRVVTGTDANGATYAPRSARCAVGSLIAK